MAEHETQAQRQERQTAERRAAERTKRETELRKLGQDVDKTVSDATEMPNPRHEVAAPEGVDNPNLSLRWPELSLDAPLYDDEPLAGEAGAARERAADQARTEAESAAAADAQAAREAKAREKRGA